MPDLLRGTLHIGIGVVVDIEHASHVRGCWSRSIFCHGSGPIVTQTEKDKTPGPRSKALTRGFMERMTGIEPATSTLARLRSTN